MVIFISLFRYVVAVFKMRLIAVYKFNFCFPTYLALLFHYKTYLDMYHLFFLNRSKNICDVPLRLIIT
jgi:hypothetical protein